MPAGRQVPHRTGIPTEQVGQKEQNEAPTQAPAISSVDAAATARLVLGRGPLHFRMGHALHLLATCPRTTLRVHHVVPRAYRRIVLAHVLLVHRWQRFVLVQLVVEFQRRFRAVEHQLELVEGVWNGGRVSRFFYIFIHSVCEVKWRDLYQRFRILRKKNIIKIGKVYVGKGLYF